MKLSHSFLPSLHSFIGFAYLKVAGLRREAGFRPQSPLIDPLARLPQPFHSTYYNNGPAASLLRSASATGGASTSTCTPSSTISESCSSPEPLVVKDCTAALQQGPAAVHVQMKPADIKVEGGSNSPNGGRDRSAVPSLQVSVARLQQSSPSLMVQEEQPERHVSSLTVHVNAAEPQAWPQDACHDPQTCPREPCHEPPKSAQLLCPGTVDTTWTSPARPTLPSARLAHVVLNQFKNNSFLSPLQ